MVPGTGVFWATWSLVVRCVPVSPFVLKFLTTGSPSKPPLTQPVSVDEVGNRAWCLFLVLLHTTLLARPPIMSVQVNVR